MTPRLDVAGPVGPALRDAARSLLAAVSASLERPPDERDEGVHDARKSLKAVRALARLVKPAVGEDGYRIVNAGARDAARVLADARDVSALCDAIGLVGPRLRRKTGKADLAVLEAAARNELVSSAAPAAVTTAALEVAPLLSRCADEVARWRLPRKRLDLYLDGMRATYAAARRRLDLALPDGDDDAAHEARKRVVDWRYQLELMSGLWPRVLKAEVRELQALRQSLGDHNDLVLLRGRVSSGAGAFGGLDDPDAILEIIDALCLDRREDARRRAELLFAEPADLRIRRIAFWWRAARRR